MPPASFDSFFCAATGHPPYDYQHRLACGERNDRSEAAWLADARASRSCSADSLPLANAVSRSSP